MRQILPVLEYSDQPAKSLAIVEWKGNDVIVQLSPSLRRTGAKILIALFLSGGIASALLAIAPLAGFCFTMTLVAFVSGLCSTEITAGADRITLCHRLLFLSRARTWDRDEIGDIRKSLNLAVIGVDGKCVARIIGFDRAEEVWLAKLLRGALKL